MPLVPLSLSVISLDDGGVRPAPRQPRDGAATAGSGEGGAHRPGAQRRTSHLSAGDQLFHYGHTNGSDSGQLSAHHICGDDHNANATGLESAAGTMGADAHDTTTGGGRTRHSRHILTTHPA